MDLSIIIVNWKSVAFLAQCLDSIAASPLRISHETIVIDNASFDGCKEMLSRRFPSVCFVQSGENTGFARANNRAFECSSGDVVCFLNPDTVIRGAALQTLHDALLADAVIGAVGARLYNGDGSVQTSSVLPFPTVMNQVFDAEWLRRRFPGAGLFGTAALFSGIQEPQAVESVSGACIMIRRRTFTDIGMFSTDYFMYAEDIDLCRKVRMTGRSVCLVNAAGIVHFGGGSSNLQESGLFGALLMRESNYRLLCKYRGRPYALLYRAGIAVAALIRLALLLLMLLPAVVSGRGGAATGRMRRWAHLFLWAAGIQTAPPPPNPHMQAANATG